MFGRPSAHSARLPAFLACRSWWSPVVDCTPRRNEATSFADGRALHLVVHAVVHARSRLPRGVSASGSRGHIRSSGLSASEEASSPARYRALRIRFDSLSNPPPVGGTRVDPLCPSWRQPVVTSVPRRRSPERLITRRRARPARDCAPCPLPDPRPRNGTRDPSSHMRCIITASLRATATSARL